MESWNEIVSMLPNPANNFLKVAKLSVTEDNRLVIAVMDEMNHIFLMRESEKEKISNALNTKTGANIDFDIVLLKSRDEFNRNYPDLSVINMEIETE